MHKRLEPIHRFLDKAISEGIFHKAVAGFIFENGKTCLIAKNLHEDAVFDIASLTKVCPTSTIALHFILNGKLDLNKPVFHYLEEFNTNYRDEVLVKHLLTHSLDYSVPMSSLKEKSPKEILDFLFNYQFKIPPGTLFNYGNPASILLGLILQKISGEPLDSLAEKILFKPLKMTRSGFFPLKRIPKEEIVPTEFCKFRGREIQGEVHDESAYILQKLFPVGSAGMFSTVPDLLKFLKMLLQDGKFENKQIVAPGILKMISENALDKNINASAALGFELNADKFMGKRHSLKTFGKTGFTGASLIGDAERQAGFVLLSDFTYPKREKTPARINETRGKLADLFFEILDS